VASVDVLGADGAVETITGTTIHPVWSVDRQEWVPLAELAQGDKPRSSWLGTAWNWITSIARGLAMIAVGVGVACLMVALAAFSPICAAVLTYGLLVLLAANATVAVMNRAASGQSGGHQ
jgi:hypothetical protein